MVHIGFGILSGFISWRFGNISPTDKGGTTVKFRSASWWRQQKSLKCGQGELSHSPNENPSTSLISFCLAYKEKHTHTQQDNNPQYTV